MQTVDDVWRAVELPTADEEIWRYSRIAELQIGRYAPVEHLPEVAGSPELVEFGGPLSSPIDDVPDAFAAVNRRLADQVRVVVPRGRVVNDPIVVSHAIPGSGSLTAPRLIIEAGVDSEVTVIEHFTSTGDGESLVLPVVQIVAGAAARVRYLAVNELHERAWSIGHQQARGERDSSTLLASVALGADYARVRAEAQLTGAGGSTRQVALYFAGGEQMHDFRTIQDHVAPHTSSDLLFKGAVQGRSKSVYTGLIRIGEAAKGSVAYQTNRNLTLSEGAWAESVPNLDIRTNDVACSHASTVGPIDDDQRFYLESRGIRPDVAERLVVLGFFDEVLDQLPAGPLATSLRERVATKLDLGSSTPEVHQ